MSVTFKEIWIYHQARPIGRSVISKKVVEDFWDVYFSYVMIQDRVVDFNMNGFSSFHGNSFSILVYYLEVGDVGLGWLLEMLCL